MRWHTVRLIRLALVILFFLSLVYFLKSSHPTKDDPVRHSKRKLPKKQENRSRHFVQTSERDRHRNESDRSLQAKTLSYVSILNSGQGGRVFNNHNLTKDSTHTSYFKNARKRRKHKSRRRKIRKGRFHLNVIRGDSDQKGARDSRLGVTKGQGRDDVSSASAASGRTGHEENPYGDVTFPPYVERLPTGAKGNGPKGLSIDKNRLSQKEQALHEAQWNQHHFNQYASDRIPVHRPLHDYRSNRCRFKQYGRNLGRLSVVIVFYNEAWSVLLRSVHSVLDTTPPHLLVHVILVDDFSSLKHLKRPLDKYFHGHPKVKVIHSPQREGLIQARLRGFNSTSTNSDVVVFLDSHVECTQGWSEPMLWMIKENPRSVVFPIIDYITPGDFAYLSNEASPHGIFGLNTFTFRWSLSLKRPRLPETEPMPSPTMPGGLFAISRRWFTDLGTYDPQLLFWGGENLELSFKAWMCGGQVVAAQCSHIGHIYRSNPLKWTEPLGPRNYVRVALVWMDQYKNHYLERINYRLGHYGNISDRVALRQRLKCQSFGWYIDHVYPELREQIVVNATYAGQFKHVDSGQCLDRMNPRHGRPALFPCHRQGGSQFWYLREDRYIQMEDLYLCKDKHHTTVLFCEKADKEKWSYESKTGHLRHVQSGHCLQSKVEHSDQLALYPCTNSSLQAWTLERRRPFQYT